MGQTMNDALKRFETVEANLVKAERILKQIYEKIPSDVVFGTDDDFDKDARNFRHIYDTLPKIDGWKPDIIIMNLDEIAQNRMYAKEIGDIECMVSVENQINQPRKDLKEYRHNLDIKRRELIRGSIDDLVTKIDTFLLNLSKLVKNKDEDGFVFSVEINDPDFEALRDCFSQINSLLGSSVDRPYGWDNMNRHLHFGMYNDLVDIIENDWPNIKQNLSKSLFDQDEPLPLDVDDIGDLVAQKPRGRVVTRLNWKSLSEQDFERLIYTILCSETTYENVQWLTKTKAPDKGRDLSAYRVLSDPLAGSLRQRVIIQCKHWLSKSIPPTEVSTLITQMKLWEPPIVDIHVIATSGRFTTDAVAVIEKQNQAGTALHIEMWAESHLESILATKPALIAEFNLR